MRLCVGMCAVGQYFTVVLFPQFVILKILSILDLALSGVKGLNYQLPTIHVARAVDRQRSTLLFCLSCLQVKQRG